MYLTNINGCLPGLFYKDSCTGDESKLLMISGRFWLSTHIGYGGPAVDDDYSPTELMNTERRHRVKETNKDKVIDRFILISIRYDFETKVSPCRDFNIRKLDDYGMSLVTENRVKTAAFIEVVNEVEERDTCICPQPGT
jgi:hypothetical protein